jgi:glycosyltransferase involved in cell wall biosynthesis
MRVLAIGNRYPPESLGGYELIWQRAMDAFAAAGHEVRVLTTDEGVDSGTLPAVDGPVHRELRWYWHDHQFPHRGVAEILRLERHNRATLARHVREFRPSVVFWWAMGGMSLSLLEQVRGAGIPALGLVGDGWFNYAGDVDGWTRAWSHRPALRGVARVLTGVATTVDVATAARWHFISEWLREDAMAGRWLVAEAPITHPGIAGDYRKRPEAPWRGRALYAGRIDPRKGIDAAVRALSHLPYHVSLTIDGSGNPAHGEELRRLATETGVDARVHFVCTAREDLVDMYAAADVVLFPVRWPEPWGLVPLEAMAVGRPVVATGTGGSAEYLRDGENCLIVPKDDPEAVARAIARLGDDPDLRATLRAGGLATATRFTEASFHAELERSARELAGDRG